MDDSGDLVEAVVEGVPQDEGGAHLGREPVLVSEELV